jgi:CDP-diacylglycerol pyrophosphatase
MARKRIAEEDAIALVVNPRGSRTQDQLHIHIVRLRSDTRGRFDGARSGRVRNLDEVWRTAAKRATTAKLQDYGVLVARDPEGGFFVLVDEKSPEKMYTQGECR